MDPPQGCPAAVELPFPVYALSPGDFHEFVEERRGHGIIELNHTTRAEGMTPVLGRDLEIFEISLDPLLNGIHPHVVV